MQCSISNDILEKIYYFIPLTTSQGQPPKREKETISKGVEKQIIKNRTGSNNVTGNKRQRADAKSTTRTRDVLRGRLLAEKIRPHKDSGPVSGLASFPHERCPALASSCGAPMLNPSSLDAHIFPRWFHHVDPCSPRQQRQDS